MKSERRLLDPFVCVILYLLTLFSCCYANDESHSETIDFPNIIQNAKDRNFPALIFVKPIVEEYSSGKKTHQEVFGSGVIISPDGYAVTNHHVIDKAVSINCVLYDKRQVTVQLIGSDKDTDLALLKLPVEQSQKFPFAEFNTSPVSEGDFVMALGSPFGFQRSISLGIISNAQRYLGFDTEYKYNTWLQTDAAINPGNSGGPLIDIDGKIIGINTLGLSGAGLGFSIPADVVKNIVEQLRDTGKVQRSVTGLRLQPLHDFHSNTFIEHDYGVLISGVEENSPAARSGILAGDILLEINTQKVDGKFAEMLPRIWQSLAALQLDKSVSLTILRSGQSQTIQLLPEEKGKIEGEDYDCSRWNMTVKEINKYQNAKMHYMHGEGVYIQGLKYPGNANNSGLQEKDIIVKIGKQEITTIGQLKEVYGRILADSEREKKVMIEVKRNGLRKWIVLDYRKDYEEQD